MIDGKSYYGHHMMNVAEYPEYAGDWRNIQALNYDEHYNGAHGGNTKMPTEGFYDVVTGKTEPIDVTKLEVGVDVRKGTGYIETQKCIFKSDAEIEVLYSEMGKLSDSEKLVLKNIEYSKGVNGSIDDFERALNLAEKYKCSSMEEKLGILSDDIITQKYSCFGDMTAEEMSKLKAYDYYTKTQTDANVIEKLGFESNSKLCNKYQFLKEGDELYDLVRMYEYRTGNIASSDDFARFISQNADEIAKNTSVSSFN